MRSVRPPLVVMLLAWLLVVTAVGVVTYLVVGSAGRDVGQASAAATVAPTPPATASPQATPRPTSTASASSTPRPTRSVTPKPPVTRTPAPAPTRTSVPAPPPVTRTTPPPSPSSTTRSFSTQGGTVVATCTGSTIRLDSITVRDGWRVENEAEDGALEVKFKAAEAEIEVTLRCVGGIPTRVGD